MSSPDGTILVGGEALFDVVASDGEDLKAHPGGGPFNAARTIARLDQPVAYLGRLSTDQVRARLERILVDDGVSLDAVVRTEDPTTLALAELGDGGSVSRYRFYAQGTSAAGADPGVGAGADGERARGGRRPAVGHGRDGRRRPELPPARHRRSRPVPPAPAM